MKAFAKIAAATTLLAATIPVSAQSGLAEKKTLTLDGAKRIVASAMEIIRRKNTTGVVAVVDEGGNVICLERADNTFPAGGNISIGKAHTAALFKRPTRDFEEIIKKGRTPMIALKDFTPLEGGVPVLVDGQIVGAVGVSGAASADQDEEIAEECAKALSTSSTGQAALTALPVSYFDRDAVTAAFSKGAVLFDGSGRNYMIHASRREKPGLVEVHTLDTDLIYVTEGSCTFVTGGTMTEGNTIAANEIRGSGIQGGEARKLTKGDVIIVPAGVPHWFQSVTGPFTYYVVKVR